MAPRRKTPANSNAGVAFPLTGLVRLNSILAPRGPIPVGRTTWFAGVKSGRYPKPVKLGPRITAYHAEEVHELIVTGAA